jgi:DNA-binding Lrp family transcriptional regulator
MTFVMTKHLEGRIGEILEILKENAWVTLEELSKRTGYTKHCSLSALVRDLRKKKNGGYKIDGRYNAQRIYEYRLVLSMPTPIERSIAHWKENLAYAKAGELDQITTGSHACALCETSLHRDGRTMNCKVCPLHLAGYGCIESLNDDMGYVSPYMMATQLIENAIDDRNIHPSDLDVDDLQPMVDAVSDMVEILKGL